MIWLTWRQHRVEALVLLAFVAAVGVVLVLLGMPVHSGFVSGGASNCVGAPVGGAPDQRQACASAIDGFRDQFGVSLDYVALLPVLPIAVGAFLGAPLLARELEAGTWQFVWTQAVPRRRWLLTKLAALAVLTIVINIGVAVTLTWYRQPWDALDGRFDAFDVEGVVPAAYGLFAFAAGVVAGALVRRSVAGLAITFVSTILVRFSGRVLVRPHLATPLTATVDPLDTNPDILRGAWRLSTGLVDATGRALTSTEQRDASHQAAKANVDLPTYQHNHGWRDVVTYQPASRFWTIQWLEAGIYLAVFALLCGVAVHQVTRRVAR